MARTASQQNSFNLEPNRGKIVKNMPTFPGSADNNNPYPVEQARGNQPKVQSLYGDFEQTYAQIGDAILDPGQIAHSGLQQSFPKAGRGYNQTPFGMAPQTDIRAEESLEGARLQNHGLANSPYMGLLGGPPIAASIPGNAPGTNGPGFLPGNGAGLIPGSTPQKIGQKKNKGGKA